MRKADLKPGAFARTSHGRKRSTVERLCGRWKVMGICARHMCKDSRNSFSVRGLARRAGECLPVPGSISFPFNKHA